jgi:hypothetical protein
MYCMIACSEAMELSDRLGVIQISYLFSADSTPIINRTCGTFKVIAKCKAAQRRMDMRLLDERIFLSALRGDQQHHWDG